MIPLLLIAAFTLASAVIALALRNLIHSALLLIASWAGIAAFYLWAGAEFVAFAQLLVYVGAISMVVLFAVLLTRPSRDDLLPRATAGRIFGAFIAGGAVFGVLAGAVLSAPFKPAIVAASPAATVRDLGQQLMGEHAAALLIVGLLLTVALLGAIVIAATPRDRAP